MTTARKPTGRAKSMPVGLALGAGTALGITLVLSLIGAKLVDMGKIRETGMGYMAMVILLLSAFFGAWIAVGCIRRQKIAVCGLAALIYYGMLLSVTALFFGGQYQGMGVTALMVGCGGGLAALASNRQGRRGRPGRGKPRHR